MNKKIVISGLALLAILVLNLIFSAEEGTSQSSKTLFVKNEGALKNQSSISFHHQDKAKNLKSASISNDQNFTTSSGRENCTSLGSLDKKTKIDPSSQRRLALCLSFLSDSKFIFSGKFNSESCFRDPSSSNGDCLDLINAFLLTQNVLDSSPEQWDLIDSESLMTALSTFQENYTDSQADKFDAFLSYMLGRFPNDGGVAKTALLPMSANSQAEVTEHLQKNLEHASRLNPDDPEVLGAEMLLAVTTGEKNVLDNLQAFNRQHPESGVGLVYEAAIYHLYGRDDLSQAAIQEAFKDKSPSVQHMAKMAKAALRGHSDQVTIMTINGIPKNVPVSSLNRLLRASR